MARVNIIHQSLLQRKLIAGIERRYFFLIWMITAAFVVAMKIWVTIVVGLAVHFFVRWLYKSDPEIMEVYKVYARQAAYYDPWPHRDSHVTRPDGFAKDLLC